MEVRKRKGLTMGIWDRLKHELIDIIQFLDDSNNTLVYRFERFQNEIKYGAKLVVRARARPRALSNEGQTRRRLRPGHAHAHHAEHADPGDAARVEVRLRVSFKAEVYFVSTHAVHRPQVGHDEPDHGARSGVRPGALRASAAIRPR